MDDPVFLTQVLPVWLSALIALVFLASVSGVASLLTARGLGGAGRLYRGLTYFLIPLLLLIPPFIVQTEAVSINVGLLFYFLIFSGFCYYLGKRTGWLAGRRHMSELIGMETPESLEDTQDRLFESRLRFPHRADVVKSIGELAKSGDAAKEGQAPAGQGDFKLKL